LIIKTDIAVLKIRSRPAMDPIEVFLEVKALMDKGGDRADRRDVDILESFEEAHEAVSAIRAIVTPLPRAFTVRVPSVRLSVTAPGARGKHGDGRGKYGDGDDEDEDDGRGKKRMRGDPQPLDRVSSAAAEAWLKCATAAPFGRGSETVVDTSVRAAFNVPASQMRVDEEAELASAIGRAFIRATGGAAENYDVCLYKLHMYNTGGHFAAHRDTLHGERHVATAVLGLVGEEGYEGGELEVEGQLFDLRTSAPGELRGVFLYTDQLHRVLPVTRGLRMSLQFDIFRVDPSDECGGDADPSDECGGDAYGESEHEECDEDNGSEDEECDEDDGSEPKDEERDGPGRSEAAAGEKEVSRARAALEKLLARLAAERTNPYQVAVPCRHLYALPALSDPGNLRGSDSVLFGALEAALGRDRLSAQGLLVTIRTDCERNRAGFSVIPAGCLLENEGEGAARRGAVETLMLPWPERTHGRVLSSEDPIEYTGNEAQLGTLCYTSSAIVIRGELRAGTE